MTAEQPSGRITADFGSFAWHLRLHYHLTLDDVEPTQVPGYWRQKRACGGRAGGCREPIHGCLFNEGSTHHTVSYYDHYRDEHGRWTSPYRTWRTAVSASPDAAMVAERSKG